eukprot:TRINITY_DN22458_c0_g1_i1.p1 TRINITY_DN22458_c0_g1~~TRINITY_DN22458_c0_g1_i1.p1  ORF type:complete len:436 (-),score=61.31 TRINITY_DN22458_c0_g1_i1:75-1382(-)
MMRRVLVSRTPHSRPAHCLRVAPAILPQRFHGGHGGHSHTINPREMARTFASDFRSIVSHLRTRSDAQKTEGLKEQHRLANITFVANVILAFGKVAVGIIGHSTALLADGIHSGSDAVMQLGVIVALRAAHKPADSCHPWGHGKVESVVSATLAALLLVAAFEIGSHCIAGVLAASAAPVPSVIVVAAAGLSVLVKESLFRACRNVGRRVRSPLVTAMGYHQRVDCFASLLVILSFVGAWCGVPLLDPLCGVVLAAVIARNAFNILCSSASDLLDAGIPPDHPLVQNLRTTVAAVPGVVEMTEFYARWHGPFVIVHVGYRPPRDATVEHCERIGSEIRRAAFAVTSAVLDVTVLVSDVSDSNPATMAGLGLSREPSPSSQEAAPHLSTAAETVAPTTPSAVSAEISRTEAPSASCSSGDADSVPGCPRTTVDPAR